MEDQQESIERGAEVLGPEHSSGRHTDPNRF